MGATKVCTQQTLFVVIITPKIIKKYEKSIVNISTLLAKFHGKKNLFKELTIVDNAGLDLTVS